MITLSITRNPSDAPWELRATPSAYDEACKTQFATAPGCRWVRDSSTTNGSGYYCGTAEAIELVAARLDSAGVARVVGLGCTQDAIGAEQIDAAEFYPRFPAEFRSYQRDGASWVAAMLAATGGTLLADDMGVGKTAQAIVGVEATDVEWIQVVCPAIVVPHWSAQIARWSSEGGARWRAPLSYDKFANAEKRRVAAKTPTSLGRACLVVDECQYVSNPKTARYKALRSWLGAHDSRPAVLLLSGTPMTARPRDLHAPLDLAHPGRWGSKWQFEKRFSAGHYEEIPHSDRAAWVADGSSNVNELATRLRHVMLRRTKASVLAELPPLTRSVIDVALPPAARRDAAAARASFDVGDRSSIQAMLSALEGHKITAACELAREIIANGGRPLLLTTRKDTAARIGAELGCPHVTGDDAVATRRGAIADHPCAAATLYCLTTGVDLVGFTAVVFVGLDWLPSRLLQCEARVHRLGQQRNVDIFYLIGIGSLDEHVREVVISRLDTFAALVGDAANERDFSAALGGSEDDLIAGLVAAAHGRGK
jgi:SWI/SNF-related matrix-associated actin-dependent regulator 1 of chromatin subfamily A